MPSVAPPPASAPTMSAAGPALEARGADARLEPQPTRTTEPSRAKGKRRVARASHGRERSIRDVAERATASPSRDARRYRDLGRDYLRRGMKREAAQAFRTYLRLAPGGREAREVRRTLSRLERR
jgi:hypothetical protein